MVLYGESREEEIVRLPVTIPEDPVAIATFKSEESRSMIPSRDPV